MLSAAPADNVLPTSAEAVVNCRILPDETREGTRDAIVRAVGDPAIEIAPYGDDHGVGPSSPAKGEVPDAIARVAREMFPQALVVTTMGTGATDSRHLRAIGMLAYGISSAPSSIPEGRAGHGAHGPDERRPEKWLAPGAAYTRAIVHALAR
jgi:acetylornithine deacetylase/succinyl-diaminopimelate desuccinylase-like protein